MHGLHAQEQQIATERHRGLQQRNQREHPERQQRVERCHRRTEIRHREYGLAPELHRCGQRTGQRFGIIAQHLFDHAHIATV